MKNGFYAQHAMDESTKNDLRKGGYNIVINELDCKKEICGRQNI